MSSTKQYLDASQPADWPAAGLLYHSLNFFYRKKFGTKVWKLSLDAGCNCPNRDGTLATLGCIFCDPVSFSPSRRHGASFGSRTGPRGDSPAETPVCRRAVRGLLSAGHKHLWANRPAPLGLPEALAHPDVVGLAIGTRPDCVGEEVLDLLAELARRTWVVVEYGLQTIHDRTLDLLNRGHHYDAFLDAYRRTRRRNLDIGVHVILGLPGESRDDMRATARELARLEIHSVKLHNLYAVRNTALADQVAAGQVRLPEFQEYVDYVVDFLEELPGERGDRAALRRCPAGIPCWARRGVWTRRRFGRRWRRNSAGGERAQGCAASQATQHG